MTDTALTGTIVGSYDGPTIEHDADLPDGAIRLPSGAWAVLRPTSAVTGRDVKRVRAALDKDGTGTILSGALAAAIGVRVAEWSIVDGTGRGVPLPFNNPAVLDIISADDLLELESLVRPWVMRILNLGKAEDKDKGADPS
jgi:hypothetical protein